MDKDQIIVLIFGSISIICSILIFTTFVYLREVRTVTRQIIICITIADFFTALANLIGAVVIGSEFNGDQIADSSSPSLCAIQSFISSTSSLCSFLWTLVLSVALHQVLVKKSVEKFEKCIPWLHIGCWLLPLAINLTALAMGKLGYFFNTKNNGVGYGTGGWCWIGKEKNLINEIEPGFHSVQAPEFSKFKN